MRLVGWVFHGGDLLDAYNSFIPSTLLVSLCVYVCVYVLQATGSKFSCECIARAGKNYVYTHRTVLTYSLADQNPANRKPCVHLPHMTISTLIPLLNVPYTTNTYVHAHTHIHTHIRTHTHTCACSSKGQRPSHTSHWGIYN
jgi:hypothetical protein